MQRIHDLLCNDPLTLNLDLETLINYNIENLLDMGLFEPQFVREKFLHEIENTQSNLKDFMCIYGIWLVEKKIVYPTDLLVLLRRDLNTIPVTDLFDDDYYTWPISKYGAKLGLSENDCLKLNELNIEYKSVINDYEDTLSQIKVSYKKNKKMTENLYVDRLQKETLNHDKRVAVSNKDINEKRF